MKRTVQDATREGVTVDKAPPEIRGITKPVSWRTRKRGSLSRHTGAAIGFLAPAVILMILIFLVPIVLAIVLSFSEYSPITRNFEFLGWDNFTKIFADRRFWSSIWITVVWTAVGVGLEYVLAMVIAVLIYNVTRGSRIYRVLFGLPWAIPPVFAALVWAALYDPTSGGINSILSSLGLTSESVNWLGSTELALGSLIVVGLWKFTPFMVLTLLAGMQAIDTQLYEAAAVDGAGAWRTFWKITLPLLAPVSVVVLTLSTIWRSKHFDIIWTLTKGGPADSTQVLSVYAYKQSIINLDLGAGAAVAVVLSLGLLVLILLMSRKIMKAEQ